jgi:hypothetical protein
MKFHDVFNGDADGLCAMHQYRLAEPRESVRVTGVKRDNALLERVTAGRGDEITVFDVSIERNRDALERVLAAGARVRWFDHHSVDTVPRRPGLRTHLDFAHDTCTSLIVDRFLSGRHRAWAVVGAFGDNLADSARAAAGPLGLSEPQLLQLQALGECLNYNAYGESLDDLHYHPSELYETIARYADPLDFVVAEPVCEVLRTALGDDLSRAAEVDPLMVRASVAAYALPDEAWARRVCGYYANRLVEAFPHRAHAVLLARPGGWQVSVRAPREDPHGADVLCRAFDGGGGRARAAGIGRLPESGLAAFLSALERAWPGRA